jgi:hypothetical protein
MKTKKDFDCVAMKWDIQQKLLQEEAQWGKEEAARRRRERLLRDPILGSLVRASPAATWRHDEPAGFQTPSLNPASAKKAAQLAARFSNLASRA